MLILLRILKIFLIILTLLILLGAAAAFFLPWKTLLEGRIKAALEEQGFKDAAVTLATVSPTRAALKDISLGSPPLQLKNVTVNYLLPELWKGKLNGVNVSGMALELKESGGKWVITGLEGWPRSSDGNKKISVPVTQAQLLQLKQLKFEESSLRITGLDWLLEIPLGLNWHGPPAPWVSYDAPQLSYKARGLMVDTGEASVKAALNEEQQIWQGDWQIKNIRAGGTEAPLPPLESSGDLAVKAEEITLKGKLVSADKKTRVSFTLTYPLNQPDKAQIDVDSAETPWNEGRLAARNFTIPLGGKRLTRLNLEVQHVSIDALLQLLTGKQATATGLVSGVMPVTFEADGEVKIGDARLRAEGPGKIALSPEVIPGDNEQVALVREILKDLRYNLLSIGLANDKDNKLAILMTLEGHNPSVYDGKPVRLNVKLTGDVMDFIQNGVLSLVDPKRFLKQGGNAKK